MKLLFINRYSGPLIALGTLVAITCLAGFWYINRLQASLAQTVRQDAAGMVAAVELQVQLRHLRVHSLTLVADDTPARWAIVQADLERVDKALTQMRETVHTPEDQQSAERIERDYASYKHDLLAKLPAVVGPVKNIAEWSDAHHMEELLEPCRQLADRQRQRMNNSLARSERQTEWAGRALFSLAVLGILAGILSGYATARTILRRETQLFVRVQAVRAQLNQNVGALTVQTPAYFSDLDQQLDGIVHRVSEVCQRLQEQERELLRAEQLAAVGQLAAAVAHEVRNPLTGVKLLLQAAVRATNPTPLSSQRLHLLLNEVGRIERTVQGLVDFAHPTQAKRETHDVRSAVAAAIEVARSRAEHKGVQLRFESGEQAFLAALDSDQFLSLLTNLLFNSIDASPAGSTIDVALTTDSNAMINLTVSDRGVGIEPGMADKLFEPFTTSKATGTGLGLFIARRIAREHGGELDVRSRTAGGTSCTLVLPFAES
jgi:signal transduction histidine kinase